MVIALLLAATIFVLPHSPVSAASGAGGSWTQLYNNNYPVGSKNANCSPSGQPGQTLCVAWPKNFFGGYGIQIPNGSWFTTDARDAYVEWNAQPFQSPYLQEDSSSQCAGNSCVNTGSLSATLCAQASVYTNNGNAGPIIQGGLVTLNSNMTFTDGPTGSCDLRSVARHEIGHVWSEGHSSVTSDLMYYNDSKVEYVDGDADLELDAVYGPMNGGGGGGCAGLTEGTAVTVPCIALLAQLKAKALQEVQAHTPDSLRSGSTG